MVTNQHTKKSDTGFYSTNKYAAIGKKSFRPLLHLGQIVSRLNVK